MFNYCTGAMFGGETITTLVMMVFAAGLLFFVAWVLADSLKNKKTKTNHE